MAITSGKEPLDSTRANVNTKNPLQSKRDTSQQKGSKPLNKQEAGRQVVRKQGKNPRMIKQARITSSSEPGVTTGRRLNKNREQKNTYPLPSKVQQSQVKTHRNIGGGVSMGTTRRIFSRENKSKPSNFSSSNDNKFTIPDLNDVGDLASVGVLPPIPVTELPTETVDHSNTVKRAQAKAGPTSIEQSRNTRPSTAQSKLVLRSFR